MGDTTASTIALWDQLATAPRPGLCQATGLHDLGAGRTCRDCGEALGPDALICDRGDGFTIWIHQQQQRPERPPARPPWARWSR